jgi:hypothetical protein
VTLCDTYNTIAYLGRERKNVTATMTATHANVTELKTRIENLWYKFFKDIFLSSNDFCDDTFTKTLN